MNSTFIIVTVLISDKRGGVTRHPMLVNTSHLVIAMKNLDPGYEGISTYITLTPGSKISQAIIEGSVEDLHRQIKAAHNLGVH